ncbi:MAG: hypothetical protein IJW30_06725, partial [Clostridia bacterium]|nr:hypothetical protein [Clostridia bacterium]
MTNDNRSTARTYDKRGHLLTCAQSHTFSAVCIILSVFAGLSLVNIVLQIVTPSVYHTWSWDLRIILPLILSVLLSVVWFIAVIGAWYMQHFATDDSDLFKGLAAFRVAPILFTLFGLAVALLAPLGSILYRNVALARLEEGEELSASAERMLELSMVGMMVTGGLIALAAFAALLYTILLPEQAAGRSRAAGIVKNVTMVFAITLLPVGVLAALSLWGFGAMTNLVGVGFFLLELLVFLFIEGFLLAL